MQNVSEYVIAMSKKAPIEGANLIVDAYEYVLSEGVSVYADFPSLSLYRSLFEKDEQAKAYTNLFMSMDMMSLIEQASQRPDFDQAFSKDFSEMRTNLRLGKLYKELSDIFGTIPGFIIDPTYFLNTIALSLFRKIKGRTVQMPKAVRTGDSDERIKPLVEKYKSIITNSKADIKGIYQGRFEMKMVDKKVQCQFCVEADLNGERNFLTFVL